MSPTIRHNSNIFTLVFKELKTDGKSFIFPVCRLPYDHVTSNLISLLSRVILFGFNAQQGSTKASAVDLSRLDTLRANKTVFLTAI